MDVDVSERAGEIREELQKVLEKSPTDYSRVLSLSTELAKLDPDNVRFFADAGLISRLGRELVSRKETALAELVKNAYDADATAVEIVFEDAESAGGRVEISDNGMGMTRDALVEGFMRLSSTIKVSEPVSPRYHRQRAGRKGIGRFAVQRLGRRLVITTQTLDSDLALRVSIDWNQFESGQDLSNVVSEVVEVPKDRDEGTVLQIEGLRDRWTDAELRRAFRYVSDLLQPFPLTARTRRSDTDPGFEVFLYRKSDDDLQLVADDESEILAYALAEIEAVVDEDGQGYWSIKSRLYPSINEDVLPIGGDKDYPSAQFDYIRGVHLKAYYFITGIGEIPRNLTKTIRDFLEEKGGMRVYRNGFRVASYGEPGNDWLGLDSAQARRVILVPLSNRNVYGFAELFDPVGSLFEETASREGLLEDKAFEELREFAWRVLRSAAYRANSARKVKRIAAGREKHIEQPPEDRVRAATERLRRVAKGSGGPVPKPPPGLGLDFEADLDEITRGLDEMTREREELLNELGMLRVLASLGIVISEFTHEIRQLVPAAVTDARRLQQKLAGGPLERTSERLHENVRRFQTYAAYFDRTVRENVSRDLDAQEVGDVVKRFVEVMRPAARQAGTTLTDEIEGAGLFSIPMHPSEWASVLFNFYSNAQKAIKRARTVGSILIRAGRSGDDVYVDVADNGDGIPDENADRIFDAFFTTSTQGGPFESSEELQGSGLGLKIVRDIADSYGGAVELVPPPDGYVTCLRFRVPAEDNADAGPDS